MHAVCVVLTQAVDVVRFIELISPVHIPQGTDMGRFFYALISGRQDVYQLSEERRQYRGSTWGK